jgi:hypothetical protein
LRIIESPAPQVELPVVVVSASEIRDISDLILNSILSSMQMPKTARKAPPLSIILSMPMSISGSDQPDTPITGVMSPDIPIDQVWETAKAPSANLDVKGLFKDLFGYFSNRPMLHFEEIPYSHLIAISPADHNSTRRLLILDSCNEAMLQVFQHDISFKRFGKITRDQLHEKSLKLLLSWSDYSAKYDENLDTLLIGQVKEEERRWKSLEEEQSSVVDQLVSDIWRVVIA